VKQYVRGCEVWSRLPLAQGGVVVAGIVVEIARIMVVPAWGLWPGLGCVNSPKCGLTSVLKIRLYS